MQYVLYTVLTHWEYMGGGHCLEGSKERGIKDNTFSMVLLVQ